MVKILVILVALLIVAPCSSRAFVGALKGLGKATGQAFNVSGEKVEQASQQSEKNSLKKQKKKRVIQPVEQTSMKTKEIDKIINGNKEQMEEDYQILNGQNEKIEGSKDYEILH